MAHNADVPRPSPAKGRPVVTLPALTAAKFEAYRAMRAAGLTKRQLAERLGWQPSQATRLFDGRHASRLDPIEAALHGLGRRLVVTSRSYSRRRRLTAKNIGQATDLKRHSGSMRAR